MSFHITEDQIKNAGFMGITGLFFIRALTSETTRFFGDVRELKRSRLKAHPSQKPGEVVKKGKGVSA